MVLLPIVNPLEKALEHGEIVTLPRPYIGYSSLGGPCKRAIWYKFRWALKVKISKRLARIFERGDLEEPRIIRDLKAIGCLVHSEQVELVGLAGHVRGHPDGVTEKVPGASKTPHLLEVKTAKASKWKEFKKLGVKKANWQYFCQMQSYMKKLKLTRALFVITNKDTEERHWERVRYDPSIAEDMEKVAFDILTADFPLPRIGDRTWHVCKMCDCKDVCHNGADIERNCRTCEYGTILDDYEWECGKHGHNLSLEEQEAGCEDFVMLEGLHADDG